MLFTTNSNKTQKFKTLQKINEDKLAQFLEFFEFACYKLSWILNYNKNPVGGNNHTHGGVINLLSRIKIQKQAGERWVTETEHGFAHGFCTLFIAYCLHPDKNELWNNLKQYERHIDRGKPRFTHADNLIVSCLLHDIMRFIDGDELHDEKLRSIAPDLLAETFTHSNPDEASLLVQADRIELMRYPGYQTWIDSSKIEEAVKTYGGWELIEHFYAHIRPVIEKLFAARDDIWFSHALEVLEHPIWKLVEDKPNVENNLGVPYYPKYHWEPLDVGYTAHMRPEYSKYFSVHTGKLPVSNCIGHTKGYYRAQAIIPLQTVKKYGCDVTCAPPSTAGRDHLFIVQHQKLPTKEWCFLYDFGTNHENQFEQIELEDLMTIRAKLFNDIYRATEMFLVNLQCLSFDDTINGEPLC